MTFREKYIENEAFIKRYKYFLKLQSFNALEQTLDFIKLVDPLDENALIEEIARLIFENRTIHAMLLNKEAKPQDVYLEDTIEITSEASPLTTCLS